MCVSVFYSDTYQLMKIHTKLGAASYCITRTTGEDNWPSLYSIGHPANISSTNYYLGGYFGNCHLARSTHSLRVVTSVNLSQSRYREHMNLTLDNRK